MIAKFPKFEKLSFQHKDEIESFVKQFPHYSDYNFTSLYAYNTNEEIEVSLLDDSLIVLFSDYLTGEKFLSFLGSNNVVQTTHKLLSHSKQLGILPQLKLIPHTVVISDKKLIDEFEVVEDQDSFDYLLSIQDLLHLKGDTYRSKRNFINRFHKRYPQKRIEQLNLHSTKVQKVIIDLFYLWEKQQNKSRKETDTELRALTRLLNKATQLNLSAVGIYNGDILIAFSIDEVIHDRHAMIHFEKANIDFVGVYQVLKQETARHLADLECEHINYEQDLGIEGLRKAKRSWRSPSVFLKKYIIKPKN